MSRRAILRWPQGSSWGHVSLCTGMGKPQFVGFVRMADPHVQELLANSNPSNADGDMWELHFTVATTTAESVVGAAR